MVDLPTFGWPARPIRRGLVAEAAPPLCGCGLLTHRLLHQDFRSLATTQCNAGFVHAYQQGTPSDVLQNLDSRPHRQPHAGQAAYEGGAALDLANDAVLARRVLVEERERAGGHWFSPEWRDRQFGPIAVSRARPGLVLLAEHRLTPRCAAPRARTSWRRFSTACSALPEADGETPCAARRGSILHIHAIPQEGCAASTPFSRALPGVGSADPP